MKEPRPPIKEGRQKRNFIKSLHWLLKGTGMNEWSSIGIAGINGIKIT